MPISTILITKLLGFLAVGALGGFAYAYLKQGIENKWANIEEIEAITGQTVLGSIPWLKDLASNNSKIITEAAYSNIALEIISKAYLNEAFILSFITTNPSKNKSAMVELIASKIAKLRSSVLLIDLVSSQSEEFDIIDLLTRVNKSLRFQKKEHDSLTDAEIDQMISTPLFKAIKYVKSDDFEYKIKMGIINLHKEDIDINDHISTKGFSLVLKHLKQNFEFVLINAPHGLMLLPEIQTLKNISDASIIISAMNTNRDNLIKAVDNYVRSKSKILGIITREENSELEKSIEILENQVILK
jgi:Mrp family chromosome partitioning ATPase